MVAKDVNGGNSESNLREDLERLKADLGALREDLSSAIREQGQSAYEGLRDRAGQARARADETAEAMSLRVREHPLAWVCGSFLAGFVIGRLFSR